MDERREHNQERERRFVTGKVELRGDQNLVITTPSTVSPQATWIPLRGFSS